ncbi:MAG TPA: hypothetical protein VKA88_08470, partial [Solirubrobacterales bacterium]|nr:hypothetical protein [Solirubrobacterales bacterium]
MRLPDSILPSPGGGAPRFNVLARAPYVSSLLLAAGMLLLTFGVAAAAELPVRDPDAVVAYRSRVFIIGASLVLFLFLDVLVRGASRAGWSPDRLGAEIAGVWRERWTRRRLLVALTTVLSFYVTYFAYRNLKSFLPLVREATFDAVLLDLDRALFGGLDPAVFLHDVLGTGLAGQVLSAVYLLYIT